MKDNSATCKKKGKERGDKEEEREEVTSNSQLVKEALISSQKSKRGQELSVWLWRRFARD